MDTNIYPLEFLYDGDCRICMFDVVRLRRADKLGRLHFIDVSAPGFDAAGYGRTTDEVLARIHAAYTKVLSMPAVQQKLRAVGTIPAATLPPAADVQAMLVSEYAKFDRLIRDANIRAS